VLQFAAFFEVRGEFVPGEGRTLLDAHTVVAEDIHVSGDRKLSAGLSLLAHLKAINARVLPLIES
jgi:hypothetical protein